MVPGQTGKWPLEKDNEGRQRQGSVNEDKRPMAVSKRRKRRGNATENKERGGDGD